MFSNVLVGQSIRVGQQRSVCWGWLAKVSQWLVGPGWSLVVGPFGLVSWGRLVVVGQPWSVIVVCQSWQFSQGQTVRVCWSGVGRSGLVG